MTEAKNSSLGPQVSKELRATYRPSSIDYNFSEYNKSFQEKASAARKSLKDIDDAFMASRTPEARSRILEYRASRENYFSELSAKFNKTKPKYTIKSPQNGTDVVKSGNIISQGSADPIVSYLPGGRAGSSAPHTGHPSPAASSAPADALGDLTTAVTAQIQGHTGSRVPVESTASTAHKPDTASGLSGLDGAVSAQIQAHTGNRAPVESTASTAHKPDAASGLSGLDEAVSAQVQGHGAHRGSGGPLASTSAGAGLWVASSPLAWPGS